MDSTGERQVGEELQKIAPNHRRRYHWAATKVSGHVLDAASGCGYGTRILAAEGKDIKLVTGVDISQEAVDYSIKHYNHDDAFFITAEILDYLSCGKNIVKEIKSFRFDWIVSFETIEHIDNAPEVLKLMRSYSDNLILSVPNQKVLAWNVWKFPYHKRHYTYEELEQMLNDAGWLIAETHTQHNKDPGKLFEGKDGQFIIVRAEGV